MSRRFVACLALLLVFSAPRSAPNLPLVVDASSSTHGQAGTSGRIGAPSRAVLEAEPGAPFVGMPTVPGQKKAGNAREAEEADVVNLEPGTVGASFAQTHIGTAAGALRGTARWFATGPNGVAAAGPRLRAALGSHWRGTLVGVTYHGRTVWVRLSDFCACGSGSIIDLPDEVFARFAPLSRGVLSVTVHWGDRNTLPATDTAP